MYRVNTNICLGGASVHVCFCRLFFVCFFVIFFLLFVFTFMKLFIPDLVHDVETLLNLGLSKTD